MTAQNDKSDGRKAVLGFVVYGIILLVVIIVYRDFMITATAVFVFIIFLVMHYAPRIRERREGEKNKK